MGRGIDETGNKYGKWLVIEKVDNPQKNGALFRCRCDCGHEQNILGKRLRAGETRGCNACRMKERIHQLAGQKYAKLTVLDEFEHRNGRIYWHCICECGNHTWVCAGNLTSGEVKSCGCLGHEYHGKPLENLTGRVFEDLTVIEPSNTKDERRFWNCKCKCGNTKTVSTTDLTTGRVKSCGCRKFPLIHPGEKFGYLTVMKLTDKRASNGAAIYECLCQCGNVCEIPSTNLRRGDWKSCGCMKNKSYGEDKIESILAQAKIPFIKQKKYEDLRADKGRRFSFDFFVNDSYIIEYDGIQHYTFTNSGWDTEEHFLRTRENDFRKNTYCFDNKIPIIRIPFYLAEIKIEDLLLESSNFVLTNENAWAYYAECDRMAAL